jgi:hypothetical protein
VEIVVLVVGALVLLAAAAIWRRVGGRSDVRSIHKHEHALEVLGDVTHSATPAVRAQAPDEVARSHVRSADEHPVALPPPAHAADMPHARVHLEPPVLPTGLITPGEQVSEPVHRTYPTLSSLLHRSPQVSKPAVFEEERPTGKLPVVPTEPEPKRVAKPKAVTKPKPEPEPEPKPEPEREPEREPEPVHAEEAKPAPTPPHIGKSRRRPAHPVETTAAAATQPPVRPTTTTPQVPGSRTGTSGAIVPAGPAYGAHDARRRRLVAGGVAVGAAAVVAIAATQLAGGGGSRHPGIGAAGATTSTTVTNPSTSLPTTTTTTSPSTIVPQTANTTDVAYVAPATSYVVTLTVTGSPCWVGIETSSSGPWTWEGTLQPGAQKTYNASGTTILRVGAPRYLKVSIDGIDVQLPPSYMQPYDMTFTPSG